MEGSFGGREATVLVVKPESLGRSPSTPRLQRNVSLSTRGRCSTRLSRTGRLNSLLRRFEVQPRAWPTASGRRVLDDVKPER